MFTYTPLGWLLLFGSILALIAIVRSAIVPAIHHEERTARVYPIRRDTPPRLPGNKHANQIDGPALIIFVILMLGIVKWSWFGILPHLAALIGLPISLADRLVAAISIGLLVGTVALAAYGIAEMLQSNQ